MAATTQSLLPDNSTTTNFRAWGQFISNFLEANGIPKTADTGQIDWATVGNPTAAGQSMGYEIRRFSDTLQATAPVFIKIEYGSSTALANAPGIWITVGTGSDGAGAITGNNSTRRAAHGGATSNVTQYVCVISSNTNRLGLAMFTGGTNFCFFVAIERTKDAAGADTPNGILLSLTGYSAAKVNQYIPQSGTVPPNQSNFGILVPTGISTGGDGLDIPIYPNLISNKGFYLNAGITHFCYFTGDVTPPSQGVISINGTNRNYYFLPNSAYIDNPARGNVSGTAFAMLYE